MFSLQNLLLYLVICHLSLSALCYAPIDVKLDFKAHQIHRVDTLNILAYTLLLSATVVTIWIFKIKRFKYLHETQLTIIYGLIAGAIIKYVGEQDAEFTYLRVVPSGPKPFENASWPFNQSTSSEVNQELDNRLTASSSQQPPTTDRPSTNELTISTNANRNLTDLIRNSKLANGSLERLNNDFPLHGSNSSAPGNFSVKVATFKVDPSASKVAFKDDKSAERKANDSSAIANKSTTAKQPNSTLELTTQQATPITEHSLKPTLPLNKENLPKLKNDSSIRPTLSSALSKNEPANLAEKNDKNAQAKANKATPKKMAATNKESKANKSKENKSKENKSAPADQPTKQPIESNETNDLNKLIKVNKNELSLKLQAPPDSLYVNLNIEDKSRNVSSKKNYIYIFKGEFAKGELVSHDDEQMVADVYSSQRAIFDPEFFFNIIIPLIIFNAGYSLKRRFFFHNLGAIFTFSIFGTIISCFTIACVLWTFMLVVRTSGFTFVDCLYFGALISATDTVTILAYFNQLNCDFNLYALVLGESVLSDAVVIVLVRSIDLFEKEYLSSGLSAADQSLLLAGFHAFLNFWRIFSLSVVVGFVAGILNALITKFTRLKDFYLLESSLFILMSYSSFLISELLELSGIVTILFTGICQAHYNFYNLSNQSKEITKKFTELLSFLAENFIFSYLGVSMFINTQHKWAISVIFFSFIAIIVGRLLNIYPLSFLLNLNRGSHKIPLKYQHVLFFSGLRGSMAYALAMQQTISESRQVILTTTSVIIIVTVIFGGGLLGGLMDVLEIDTGIRESDQEMQPFSKNANGSLNNGNNATNHGTNQSTTNLTKSPFASICPTANQYITQPIEDDKAWLVRKWYIFDCKFLKPFLCNSSPNLIHTLPNVLLPLAKLLTTNEQLNNALHTDYQDASGCGFNNVNYHANFTGVTADGDELIEEQTAAGDRYDRNSNYQRYSFENANFEESSYLPFGMSENRQQLNELLEKSVGQLVQNSDGGQQIIFDRLTHNQPKESTTKQTK